MFEPVGMARGLSVDNVTFACYSHGSKDTHIMLLSGYSELPIGVNGRLCV